MHNWLIVLNWKGKYSFSPSDIWHQRNIWGNYVYNCLFQSIGTHELCAIWTWQIKWNKCHGAFKEEPASLFSEPNVSSQCIENRSSFSSLPGHLEKNIQTILFISTDGTDKTCLDFSNANVEIQITHRLPHQSRRMWEYRTASTKAQGPGARNLNESDVECSRFGCIFR